MRGDARNQAGWWGSSSALALWLLMSVSAIAEPVPVSETAPKSNASQSELIAQARPLPADLEGYDEFWEHQTPAERIRRVRGNVPSRETLLELGAIAQANGEPISSSLEDNQARSPATDSAPIDTSELQVSEAESGSEASSKKPNLFDYARDASEVESSENTGSATLTTGSESGDRASSSDTDTADTDTDSTTAPDSTTAVERAERNSSSSTALPRAEPNAVGEESSGGEFNETAYGDEASFAEDEPIAPEAADESTPTASDNAVEDPQQPNPPSYEYVRPPQLPEADTFSSEVLQDTTQFLTEYGLRSLDPPITDTSAADVATAPAPPSETRQRLKANVQTTLPLDPSQLNITADDLSYDPERNVGIASGNARLQLSDGTTITGDKLLFYRDEERLVSEGPFRFVQPSDGQGSEQREINGSDLDFHIPTRTAEFKNSLTIVPGEEEGTYVFIRSETTTALVDDEIYFDNATVTTSPEAPITHYVKGDRVEVYPDDRLVVRNARMFAGGEETPEETLRSGTQVAYFPLFIYSLKDHQWILPGQSQAEGAFVKSSWAYRINEYNHGGLRFDILQRKGIGLGFVHDYILPIPDSINYGRAQYYVVTEADNNRTSSRYRLDHYFEFDRITLFNNEGSLEGRFNLNIDDVFRPDGGRNDDADGVLNATFRTGLSTSTLNVSRSGSLERGTYSFPLTLTHNQRYKDISWLTSDLRFDYDRRVRVSGEDPEISQRWTLSTRARPPGWGGSYSTTYRGRTSTTGDLEARRNLEFNFTADTVRLGNSITLSNSLSATRNQIVDPDNRESLRFYDRYDLKTALRFSSIDVGDWLTITPGSIDYQQVAYSTDNSESVVRLDPRLSLQPTEWSDLDVRYSRIFTGDNSAPFGATVASREQDRISATLTLRNTNSATPSAPPGYLAFEDDLPGETPIALIFEDDSPEQLEAIALQEREALQADIRHSLRFTSYTGYDFLTQRWDTLRANFTWHTIPNLFDLSVSTSYDLNEGELNPITIRYARRSSTTFDRNLRSGLDTYEPGISYGLQAAYDPEKGELSDYSFDIDATIGTRWQNHWRLRFGLDEDGLNRIEVRRDLRDFELRMAYDPQASSFKIESILVAFPSRPVGLTQERGDFLLNLPGQTLGFDEFLP
ncbi:MAG: hypothetical protein AAFY57_09840 [Cyanobacteria bacterium J06642_2]